MGDDRGAVAVLDIVIDLRARAGIHHPRPAAVVVIDERRRDVPRRRDR